METSFASLINSPITAFTILLLVVLTIPPIFERLRLPGLVGLLFAGVVLGSDGLGLLNPETDAIKLLSDIGKIYLMFVAGLEIDLAEFRKTKNRSMIFGLATFLLPLGMGVLVGWLFGFGWNSAFLIGSLMASHTLLGYPIVQRLGLVRCQPITVTIGATIFTDIAALLVLAICVAIHAGSFSLVNLIIQLAALALYSTAVLLGLDWVGKDYFRRTGDEESNQFLFILLSVFLAAVGAQLINIDPIVGAFLAGLAVNDVVGRGPVEEKVEFVGSTLFIPFFFVGMGLLLDVTAFIESLTLNLGLTAAIVGGLLVSKLGSAAIAKGLFRYSWPETLTMWSLSIPQVAATLAAALAAFEVGLISSSVFNSVIVLMLVTSLLGPLLTERFAVQLSPPKADLPLSDQALLWSPGDSEEQDGQAIAPQPEESNSRPFTIIVAVSNPFTTRYLMELASMLARHESGIVVPLAIATAHVHMDEPQLAIALRHSHRRLAQAREISQTFGVQVDPRVRIDDDVADGISRIAREYEANLIVMGWSEVSLRSRLFGNVTNNVFWASHCPVAVTRLLDDPGHIHSILVPVKNLTPQALHTVRFAQLFANTNQASLLIVHVCDRYTPNEQIQDFEEGLADFLSKSPLQLDVTTKTLISDDVAQTILELSQTVDLVVLRSMRRRTAGGLAVSDVTTEVIENLTCSVVLFGEPHS